MRQAEVLRGGLGFLEGARWHAGRFWFAEFASSSVMTLDQTGRLDTIVEVPGHPSGIGWLPDDRLLVVSWEHRKLMRLDPEGLVEHADLTGIAPIHTNDMVVDGEGRAWVGNWGFALSAFMADHDLLGVAALPDLAEATLARVDPDGSVHAAAGGLRFPNGSVVTPDGQTLVVAETFAQRLSAFEIDMDGTLANRRVWAELPGIVPDGIALDAEGAIWVANPAAAECVRVMPGGRIIDRVATSQPCYACALGGTDRRMLHLLTNPPFGAEALGGEHGGGEGRIEVIVVDSPGAGWP